MTDLPTARAAHREKVLDALRDGHPNPEGFLEWYDSLTDEEWCEKFTLKPRPTMPINTDRTPLP